MTLLLQTFLEPRTKHEVLGSFFSSEEFEFLRASVAKSYSSGELQVFKLTNDFQQSAWDMLNDVSVQARMLSLVRPVANPMWIELPVGFKAESDPIGNDCIETTTGFLIQDEFVHVLSRLHSRRDLHILYLGDVGAKVDWETKTVWTTAVMKKALEHAKNDATPAIGFLFSVLAIMNIPGASEESVVKQPERLQRSRLKQGKLPLLEYREVKMKAGGHHGSSGHQATDGSEPAFHKRRHHVVGHIRLRHANEPLGEWSWVRPHWRGDATLGIVLKEREVEL